MRLGALPRNLGTLVGVLFATATGPSCGEPSLAPAREAEITGVLAAADESLLRVRPALEAGKLTRMSLSATDFFRGGVPLYRHDVRDGTSAFGVVLRAPLPLVPSVVTLTSRTSGRSWRATDRWRSSPTTSTRRMNATSGTCAGSQQEWRWRRSSPTKTIPARERSPRKPGHRPARRRSTCEDRRRSCGEPRTRVGGPGDNPILRDLFERSSATARGADSRAHRASRRCSASVAELDPETTRTSSGISRVRTRVLPDTLVSGRAA